MKTYKIITLGCRTNQYESQAFVDQLVATGWSEALNEGSPTGLCVVNTCTVTQSADKKSLSAIRKMGRRYQPKILVVTGCFSERAREEVLQVPGVTHVISNGDKEQLLSIVFPDLEWPEFRINHFEAHTRAFVKVQDGCDSFCSYCVIPFVRGRSRSKPIEKILQEVKGLIANGYREIVLTGINIGDFEPISLGELVKQVDSIDGLERLRLSSIDPDEVDDQLIDAIVNGKHTCPSMHIVLQSGSNTVLKRMRRKYTMADFFNAVEKLKHADPLFTFTTDVIVGFPGETKEEFLETVKCIQDVRFAKVHMFPYSDRPKTRASRMPNKIPLETIESRKQQILNYADTAAASLRGDFIGMHSNVLLEDRQDGGYIKGYTRHFLPVFVKSDGLRTNTVVNVRLIANNHRGLVGEYLL